MRRDGVPASAFDDCRRGSLLTMSTEAQMPANEEELKGLERRVSESAEVLEDFGPDYGIEFHPTAHKTEGSGIRDATLGANDGLVSVLTLIAGVAGADPGRSVLIAGVAALIAGAISMGVGAFVSARAYRAYFLKELRREIREMREVPEVEREEIREVYRARGFHGEGLEMVVRTITSDPKVWLRVMMQEELGQADIDPDILERYAGLFVEVALVYRHAGPAKFDAAL